MRTHPAALHVASLFRLKLGVGMLVATIGSATARDADIAACLDRRLTAEQQVCIEALHRAASVELETLVHEKLQAARLADERATMMRSAQPPPLGPAITRSQDAWQAYRDAECRGIVGRPLGSIASVQVTGCLTEKTRERIRELRRPFHQR